LLKNILKNNTCIACQILKKCGVDFETLNAQLSKFLDSDEEREYSNEGATYLEQYGKDLTQLAQLGKLDKVIGRQEELEKMITILSRKTKNNPIIIGEAGVGKTALVNGLAYKIIANDVPEKLKNTRN
jgi:ATP-dependent Clp protease ATP-binding subunit ClpA